MNVPMQEAAIRVPVADQFRNAMTASAISGAAEDLSDVRSITATILW